MAATSKRSSSGRATVPGRVLRRWAGVRVGAVALVRGKCGGLWMEHAAGEGAMLGAGDEKRLGRLLNTFFWKGF